MLDELRDISFHDAEVVALRLEREGTTVELDLDISGTTGKRGRLRLRFEGVTDLEVGGFNEQNVLFDLKLVRLQDPPLWDVTLEPSYGLGGRLRCREVRVVSSR